MHQKSEPMITSHFLTHLKSRRLLAQASHEDELEIILSKGPLNEKGQRYAVYCGFDPTAKSLHIGNLAQIMTLRRAQDCGLTPIVLFGGATGLIGDPTGRTELRKLNTQVQINEYIENFKKLVQRYFRTDVPNPPVYLNNIDWTGQMSWLDFLRNVGMHFTVARLLAAEVNKTRFEEGGLTFMELGYQLLQAYDFLILSREHNCVMQVGGNDQWSNILAGADLIRRVDAKKAFAITTPLLVGSDGRKYGKTAGNATWLDAEMTSPYEFFQFFRSAPDADVDQLLRTFSLTGAEAIAERLQENAKINETKTWMAHLLTEMVHGKEHADQALSAAQALFSGTGDLSSAPTTFVTLDEVKEGLGILSLLVKVGLCSSNGDARKLMQGNGLSINGGKANDPKLTVTQDMFQTESAALVLKKGAKTFHLVKIQGA
jgi:tyrosyl-tRNA synthetase